MTEPYTSIFFYTFIVKTEGIFQSNTISPASENRDTGDVAAAQLDHLDYMQNIASANFAYVPSMKH